MNNSFLNNIYKRYFSKILNWFLNLIGSGPARFVEAGSIPISDTFEGFDIVDTYRVNQVFPEPFYINEISQTKYLEVFQSNNEEIHKDVGIITAKNVSLTIPSYFHMWEGKVFKEIIAYHRFEKIERLDDLYSILRLESINFKKTKQIQGEAIFLLGQFPQNYFHWVIQMLPKIALFENNEKLKNLPIVIPKRAKIFVRESLEALGYLDQVLFLDDGVYQFEKLHLCTHIHSKYLTFPQTVQWLRDKCIKEENNLSKKRIFISRKDAPSRYISNESELYPILQQYGFEILELSDYNFKEKVKLFQEAEIIVTTCGAALANLVFATEGSVVIELFPENMLIKYYSQIAALRKLKYGFMICPENNSNLYVEPEKLQNLIEQGLNYL